MTHIKLRSLVVRGSTPGNWRSDTTPLTRWPEAPRYCPCGTRLRRTKPPSERLCDTCDDQQRAKTDKVQAWLQARGL